MAVANEDYGDKLNRSGKLFRWSRERPLTRANVEAWLTLVHAQNGANQSLTKSHMYTFLSLRDECKYGAEAPNNGIPKDEAGVRFLFDSTKSTGPRLVEKDFTSESVEKHLRLKKTDVDILKNLGNEGAKLDNNAVMVNKFV